MNLNNNFCNRCCQNPCCCCIPGPAGPQGPQGPAGPQGPQGPAGEEGIGSIIPYLETFVYIRPVTEPQVVRLTFVMPEDGTLEWIVLSLYVFNASGNLEEMMLDFELYTCPYTESHFDEDNLTLVASGILSPPIPPLTETITLTADKKLNIDVVATTKIVLAVRFSSEFTTLIEGYISGGLLIS